MLWLAAIRAECGHRQRKEADILMSKALRECPKSGTLWAAELDMAPLNERERTSADALESCDKDPHVIAAVAELFWLDGKVERRSERGSTRR